MPSYFTEGALVYDANNRPVPVTFHLDSLASYSFISPQLYQQLGLTPSGVNSVSTANGISTKYVVMVAIQLRDYGVTSMPFMVIDGELNGLGIDAIRRFGLLQQT